MLTFMRTGWGLWGERFMQTMSAPFIPDGACEQVVAITELPRLPTPLRAATHKRKAVDRSDIFGNFADIRSPTLVLRFQADAERPLDPGLELACGIHGASFQVLESRKHFILEHLRLSDRIGEIGKAPTPRHQA